MSKTMRRVRRSKIDRFRCKLFRIIHVITYDVVLSMAGMDKKYVEVLDGHLELLVNTLPTILEMVLVKMNTHFLDHQKETIRTQTSSVRKVVEFVNALRTMQNESLYKFLNVLDEMNYQHVANEIRRAANIDIPDTRPAFASPQGSK